MDADRKEGSSGTKKKKAVILSVILITKGYQRKEA